MFGVRCSVRQRPIRLIGLIRPIRPIPTPNTQYPTPNTYRASGRRKFRRVREQVAHHLGQPGGIALGPEGRFRKLQREGEAGALQLLAEVLGGVSEEGRKVEPLGAKVDLSPRDAGDVEEILQQVSHVACLAVDDLTDALEAGLLQLQLLQDDDRVPNGGEWVAQFVGEHGEELIFAAVGLL